MNFLIMLTIVAVFSAGVLWLTLETMPQPIRLAGERLLDAASLRKRITGAAAELGRRAAFLRTARQEELICKELNAALSVLRNHASVDRTGAAVTTDHILEQFAQTDGILAKHYAYALRLLRTGRSAEAVEYFAAAAGVELARDFLMLVLDWDAVSPNKLSKSVSAMQNALKETRTTKLIHRNEALSDLVYLPVVACVLVIFVNFIYVAYFAEQSALLAELFY